MSLSVKCVGAAWVENRHPVLPSLAKTPGGHQRARAVCGNGPRGARAAEVRAACAGNQGPRRNRGQEWEDLPRLVGVVADSADGSHAHPSGNREGCYERPLTDREG